MTTYALPAALRDALLAYLMQRPYSEVAEGVAALQALTACASCAAGAAGGTDG